MRRAARPPSVVDVSEHTQDMILAADRQQLVRPTGRRVGDIERAACCDDLAEHFAAGRLREDELGTRLDRAVRAVTDVDLRRLVADLPPRPSSARPLATPRPTGGTAGWSAITALALVAFIISGLVAGGMLLVLGAVNPLLFLGACLGGGAALVCGVSGSHLLHQVRSHLDRQVPPTPPAQ